MNPTDQLNLAKIAQEKEMIKGKLFSERLNTELFPSDKLSESWRDCVRKAIMNSQPMSHRLSLAEFSGVVSTDIFAEITLFQFGVLSNSLETVSPVTLGLDDEDYSLLIKEAVQHIEWYGKHIIDIRDEIQLQVDKDYQMKTAVLKGNNILKPVIGEA